MRMPWTDPQEICRTFPGPVTRQLTEAYWALHDEPAHRDPVDYA